MIELTAVCIFRSGSKITRYVLIDKSGKMYVVSSELLKHRIRSATVNVTNLKMTKNDRLIYKSEPHKLYCMYQYGRTKDQFVISEELVSCVEAKVPGADKKHWTFVRVNTFDAIKGEAINTYGFIELSPYILVTYTNTNINVCLLSNKMRILPEAMAMLEGRINDNSEISNFRNVH